MKICKRCGTRKSLINFSKEKRSKDGLTYWCKECLSIKDRSRYLRKSSKIKARVRNYWHKNKVRLLKNKREYYYTNRERLLEQKAAYHKTPHGRFINFLNQLKRRERLLNLSDVGLSKCDWLKVMKTFEFKCFNCFSKTKLTMDHHHPLSLGERLTVSNAVVLCNRCNASKNNTLPGDFYSLEKLKQLNLIRQNLVEVSI